MTSIARDTGRQSIETYYIGPTDVKGSRIKARCQAGYIVLHWDHALNEDKNHAKACAKLADKLEWGGLWRGALNAKGDGMVWVDIS